jgi:hypothetical protein
MSDIMQTLHEKFVSSNGVPVKHTILTFREYGELIHYMQHMRSWVGLTKQDCKDLRTLIPLKYFELTHDEYASAVQRETVLRLKQLNT